MNLLQRMGAVLALAAVPGCAPSVYLAMQPEQGSGVWQDGRERTRTTQDSLVVDIGFVRYEGSTMVFDVDIQNQSGRAVLVAPEQFTYVPAATILRPPNTMLPYFREVVTAINPEQKLDGLTAAVAYNVRQSERPMILASPEYGQQYRIEHNLAAARVQEKKQEVEQHILRKNTLAPGQGIRGYVYFPRRDQADVLRLKLPLRVQPVVVAYNQLQSPKPTY